MSVPEVHCGSMDALGIATQVVLTRSNSGYFHVPRSYTLILTIKGTTWHVSNDSDCGERIACCSMDCC